MKYSVEKMHEIKYGRRSGKSVDAMADLIGKIMVTENETIVLVVKMMNRADHLLQLFTDLCKNHFDETPIVKNKFEWGIRNYSSRIKVMNMQEWDKMQFWYQTIPTFDLD